MGSPSSKPAPNEPPETQSRNGRQSDPPNEPPATPQSRNDQQSDRRVSVVRILLHPPNEPPATPQSRNDQQSDWHFMGTVTHSSSTGHHLFHPPNEPPVTHSTNEHQEPDQEDAAPVMQSSSSSSSTEHRLSDLECQLSLPDESFSTSHILTLEELLETTIKEEEKKKKADTTREEQSVILKLLEKDKTKQSVPPMKRSSSYQFIPPNMSELRVVLLGNSWSERSSVGNFILGETKFNTDREPDDCVTERGWLEEKEMVLINTPDLLNQNIDQQRMHIGFCQILSAPGPHVFLLVLQPEDFTEEHRLKLCKVLELFSDRSFHHSLVLISTPIEESPGFMEEYRQHPPLKEMIRKCQYRFLWRKDLELSELLTRLGQIMRENNGEHVNA